MVFSKFEEKLKSPTHRYRSFEFCYDFFYHNHSKLTKNEELKLQGCVHLWSYLASWGMLRGSSTLLQLNMSSLLPLIEYISKCEKSYWEIDLPYNDEEIKTLLSTYKDKEFETLIDSYKIPVHKLDGSKYGIDYPKAKFLDMA